MRIVKSTKKSPKALSVQEKTLIQGLKRLTARPISTFQKKDKNGKVRTLCILDDYTKTQQKNFLKYATPLAKEVFSPYSYAYIEGCSSIDALRSIRKLVNAGYKYAVLLDIEKAFDSIDHNLLEKALNKTAGFPPELSSIVMNLWVKAPISTNGTIIPTTIGIHQGMNISALLFNILLTNFDNYCTRKGYSFIRYADDILILCEKESSAKKAYKDLSNYLETRLNLKINPKKSQVASICDIKFLGYYFARRKDKSGEKRLFVLPDEKIQSSLESKVDEAIFRYKKNGDLHILAETIKNTRESYKGCLKPVNSKKWKKNINTDLILKILQAVYLKHTMRSESRFRAYRTLLEDERLARQLAPMKLRRVEATIKQLLSTEQRRKMPIRVVG